MRNGLIRTACSHAQMRTFAHVAFVRLSGDSSHRLKVAKGLASGVLAACCLLTSQGAQGLVKIMRCE
eukprot:3549277-Pleurochrysis_carterae.AAC.5